ncbi:MAG: nuclear transport factor 2 family protein [Gemmatimonadales bacterium]
MTHTLRTASVLIAMTLSIAADASAQAAADVADEEAVVAVVSQRFDGMRMGDSAMVRRTFAPEARLMSTGIRDGQPTLQSVEIDRFVEAVGTPHEEVWDERLWNIEVRVDANLATVWTDYAFYLGDELSHCGVDAFQLFRSPDGWKIFQIADTRRGADTCEIGG